MTKCLLVLSFAALLCYTLRADDSIKSQDRDLSDLLGRVFLTLSNGNVVSGQTKGGASLWVNAKLADVEEPMGKSPSSATRLQKELVPDSNGIVLHFYGPYNPHEIQKVWTTWHNAKARKFEISLSVSKGIIGIQGSYGDSFSPEIVKELLALSQEPAINQ